MELQRNGIMGNRISWEWEMESQRNGVTPEWNHGEWNLLGMGNGISEEWSYNGMESWGIESLGNGKWNLRGMELHRNGNGKWNLRGMELEQNGIARESWKCDTDLWLVHSEEREANSDLSGEGGAAQSDDESGLAGDCRQLVVEPRHLILLLVAIETVHLCRINSILVG